MEKFLAMMLTVMVIMIGCQADYNGKENTSSPQPLNLSNTEPVNQDVSRQAAEVLREKNQLKDVMAVNNDKKFLIAVQVPHNDRFHLKEIEKKLVKIAEENFPDHEVTLSLDKKIHLEVMKLKEQLAQGKTSEKKLTEEINRIIKLSKEKT